MTAIPAFTAAICTSPGATAARRTGGQPAVPTGPVRGALARGVAVIRVDAVWMSTQPLDMRAGPETALARVVQVFGAARTTLISLPTHGPTA